MKAMGRPVFYKRNCFDKKGIKNMNQNKKEFFLLKVVLLTGLAFAIGGFLELFWN